MAVTTRYRSLVVGLVVGMIVLASGAIVLANAGTVAVADSVDAEKQVVSHSAGDSDEPAQFGGFVGETEQIDPDRVLLDVALDSDGEAAWTVEYRVRLDDANATDAFESYREDVEANTTAYTTDFGDRLGATVRRATNATGREMAIRNVTVDVDRRQLPQEYGIVTYRFAWTNFGVVEGDRLGAGDALTGFFLDEETTMTVSWPGEFRRDTVEPPAADTTEDSVTWEGPLSFDTDEPRLVVTTQPTADGGDSGLGWLALIAIVALAIGGAAVAAYWYRTRGDQAAETAGGNDKGVPPELLTDEERVVNLLAERGGRVKQQEIATTFEWTDAKTSQVVTRLRENDDVDVLRIGRENVVSLPEGSDI